jgi:hypothetical protein
MLPNPNMNFSVLQTIIGKLWVIILEKDQQGGEAGTA